MGRPGRIRRGCLWALLALAVAVPFFPIIHYIGGNYYRPVEFRIKCVDSDGKPVPGVTLRVFTQRGGVSHFYPVDEFLPDTPPPTSDAEGSMVFHHANAGLEFDTTTTHNLLGWYYWESGRPEYDCVFLLGDREVHRVRYRALDQQRAGTVRRRWEFKNLRPDGDQLRLDEDYREWQRRVLDTNRDGRIDLEEIVVDRHLSNVEREAAEGRNGQEIGFYLVERTIVVAGR